MDIKHYLVVGLGKTGHSIARYSQDLGASFELFDTRSSPELLASFRQEFPNITLYLEQLPDKALEHVSAIILSPGLSLDLPFIQKAQTLEIPIYGDIECLARALSVPMIGITGTNGKSTVTTLVGLMTQAFGLKTAVAGNIGTPVLELLADHHVYDLWVLELSSFQLDLTESLKPFAATILNITPDHLDRHHSMEAYIDAKQSIYHQANHLIYNRDDALTKPRISCDPSKLISFGLNEPEPGHWGIRVQGDQTVLSFGSTALMPVSQMKIKGQHNWANALAACALAHTLGVSFSCMQQVLETFSGLAHRSQWVRSINGVDWINDSKGTNVGATQSAISGIGESISGKIVLIAGGQGKGADFNLLREPVGKYVRSIVLLGVDADKLHAALHDMVDISHVDSLDQAVKAAQELAYPGDVVLLSPACASLDMFRDFNHRGQEFQNLVEQL